MNPRKQYEKEYPERVGETDKVFAESLYIEWLEAKVIAAQPDVIGSLPTNKCRECDKVFKGGSGIYCSDECAEANYR